MKSNAALFLALTMLAVAGCGDSDDESNQNKPDAGRITPEPDKDAGPSDTEKQVDAGPKCTDDCSSDGKSECGPQGQRTCTKGSDGCLHWGPSQQCQNGQVCVLNKCGNCTGNDMCDDLSVCAGGRCSLAAGKTYVFTIVSADVVEKAPDGSAWDAFGGAPDPFAAIFVDDKMVGRTKTKQDTFKPVWNESFDAIINTTSKLEIALYDEDVSSNDTIDSVRYSDPIALVKNGGISGSLYGGSKTSLTVTIKPK